MYVYFEGFGCTQNKGETNLYEQAARGLEGITVVDTEGPADICVIGTCVVIETTQIKMFRRIGSLVEAGKTVAVTGCLPKVMEKELRESFSGIELFGFTDTLDFKNWLMSCTPKEPAVSLSCYPSGILEKITPKKGGRAEKNPRQDQMDRGDQTGPGDQAGEGDQAGAEDLADRVDRAPHSMTHTAPRTAILPISQGCLGGCTYCITRLARGQLSSYDPLDLLGRMEKLVAAGNKEILVTAQDSGIYGFDRTDIDLPGLVKQLASVNPGDGVDYRIRIGMMNPDGAERILPGLIEVLNLPRVFRFVHIPVQSGDDEILAGMKRRYTVERFRQVVHAMREGVEDLMLSTDIIAGFPAETEEQFQRSYDLVNEIRPDILNITRFSPRPGTPAFEMDGQVHGRVSKQWSRRLTELRKEIGLEKNRLYIGRTAKALVTESGTGGKFITRLDNYKVVLVDARPGVAIGRWINVKITGASDIYLEGDVLI